MPSLRWAVLCQRVLVDAQSGSVSYVDCVDSVGSDVFPFSLPSLFICFNLLRHEGDPDEITFRVGLEDSAGVSLFEAEIDPVAFSEQPNLRLNVEIGPVPFPSPGTYLLYAVAPDGSELVRIPITVDQRDRAPEEWQGTW